MFVGSVNDENFLADKTGNRRYYTMRVRDMNRNWPAEFIDQLWAQAFTMYCRGALWWPKGDDERILRESAESFEVESPWMHEIENYF